jgi:hypothetical protein
MSIIKKNMIVDEVLEAWQSALGDDFIAYKNHCYRVLNFYAALIAKTPMNMDKGAIAIAFHDLGIWSHQTFDYLAPSEQLAREYLQSDGHAEWIDEVVAMIANHHKVRTYQNNPLVEAMRKADWIDVSLGNMRFGLDKSFIQFVKEAFPNNGFHQLLAKSSAKHILKHPLNPIPMFKL